MNSAATSLLWCILQVTLVCVIALLVDHVHHRFRLPWLGSSGFFASIVVLGLTAAAFSPWPRWSFPKYQSGEIDVTNNSVSGAVPIDTLATYPSETIVNELESKATTKYGMRVEVRRYLAGLTGNLRKLVLPVLILSLAIGAIRFSIGLIAIRRIARTATPVDDDQLTSLVNELRSAIRCRRVVSILETAEVRSPATIGWRRPVVILPLGWRDWSIEQTRAVLAHEVAHISRNDFAFLAIAQLTTIFHFYHPLVNRLVENLRLDQELAADAVASSIIGGKRQYLAVLATMTLQDQPMHSVAVHIPSPARPFLTAPRTLSRRIEMLQATDSSVVSLSKLGRTTALIVMLSTGIMVAGLRPGTATAQKNETPAAEQPSEQQTPASGADHKVGRDPPLKAQSHEDEVKKVLADLDTDDVAKAESQLAEQLRQRPEDVELRYRLALIQGELGQTDKALTEMRRLVQTERAQRAARWIIRTRYDKRKWVDLSEAERDEFGSLANLMYEQDPDEPKAANLYADYLIAAKDFAGAFPVLRSLAETNPLRGLQAAAVARRLRREEEANSLALRSLDALSQRLKTDEKNLSVSLAVAQNQLFLRRYDDAIETIEEAIENSTLPKEQSLAREALGDSIIAKARHLESTTNGSVDGRRQILQGLLRAYEQSPENPRVLTTIQIYLDKMKSDSDEQVVAFREKLIEATSEPN